MNLYELSSNYVELLNCDLEIVADTLESLEDAFKEKSVNIAYVIKNIEAENEIISNEIKRLQERKKVCENKKKYLKEYLYNSMQTTGITNIKTPTITINIRKNPPSLDVKNEEEIPDSFYLIKRELKRKEILDFIKNGGVIEGCEIKQGTSISIR